MLLAAPPAAASSDPAQWPAEAGVDPDLDASSHTIRFSGPDRFQTNLAQSLALRGVGGFPFDTSDRTSGNAPSLAAAGDWWGVGSCPRSVILVAGDTFADALAAASLSDPSDLGREPLLERVAAADPTFDPPGELDRVETAFAPVIVTSAARSGSTALVAAARRSAEDLARGGCATAREAIIVGGPSAVPRGVEAELVGLGYEEVFRVAGADRYQTAARIAAALGTSAVAPGEACADPDASDGSVDLGFHGAGAPEYRFDSASCRVLSRSVVLADGSTGADALAAGWWTSRWQVPVLLTAPDGSLPPATQAALRELDIDHLIVLGGTDRIPEESTVDVAERLAGAVAGRIAGSDRYETSVKMAEAFGGWFATEDGADFAGDRVCVAASSGAGSNTAGWADALSAGPWCARLSAAARTNPERQVPFDASGTPTATLVGGRAPSHGAAPILLVPTSSSTSSAAFDHLARVFDAGAAWCGATTPSPCVDPGFAVIHGGAAAVSPGAERLLSVLVSGGLAGGAHRPQVPSLERGFLTLLDLAPVYTMTGTGSRRVCHSRGAARDVRWLSLTEDAERRKFLGEHDLGRAGGFDADGSPATCVSSPNVETIHVTGVSPAGDATVTTGHPAAPEAYVALDRPLAQRGVVSRAADGLSFTSLGPPAEGASLSRGPAAQPVSGATLDLRLRFTSEDRRQARFTGTASVSTAFGTVRLEVAGEGRLVSGEWLLRGNAVSDAAGVPRGSGGFSGQLATEVLDPQGAWRFDGFPLGGEVSGIAGSG